MGAVELRNKIIQLLNTDNINYLSDVFEFAEKKRKNDAIDAFLELPSQVQDLLLESKAQADRGEVTPHSEVMAEARKRFNLHK